MELGTSESEHLLFLFFCFLGVWMWLVEYWQAIDPQTLPHVWPSQVKSCMACRTNLLSAVRHILRIAGQKLAAPLPTHRG